MKLCRAFCLNILHNIIIVFPIPCLILISISGKSHHVPLSSKLRVIRSLPQIYKSIAKGLCVINCSHICSFLCRSSCHRIRLVIRRCRYCWIRHIVWHCVYRRICYTIRLCIYRRIRYIIRRIHVHSISCCSREHNHCHRAHRHTHSKNSSLHNRVSFHIIPSGYIASDLTCHNYPNLINAHVLCQPEASKSKSTKFYLFRKKIPEITQISGNCIF